MCEIINVLTPRQPLFIHISFFVHRKIKWASNIKLPSISARIKILSLFLKKKKSKSFWLLTTLRQGALYFPYNISPIVRKKGRLLSLFLYCFCLAPKFSHFSRLNSITGTCLSLRWPRTSCLVPVTDFGFRINNLTRPIC